MTPTELKSDFTKDLIALIERFHEVNPTLFVYDIRIHSDQYITGKLQLLGVETEVRVQTSTIP